MGVIEASDRAWKVVQMKGEKQGVSAWLRGIIGMYDGEPDDFNGGCPTMAKMFGVVCKEETCLSCMVKMMTAIADRIDAERALPEGIEWPRFEDGELVKVGDEIDFHGVTVNVHAVKMCADSIGLLVVDGAATAGTIRYDYSERVKRPTPKVLDADGAPIEVGDTVYGDDETSPLTVVRLFKDATGATLVDCVGSACSIGTYYTVAPSRLTHERPESWERIEEDAKLAPRAYLEARGMNPEKTERVASMMADIVRRAKALAKAGEVE